MRIDGRTRVEGERERWTLVPESLDAGAAVDAHGRNERPGSKCAVVRRAETGQEL